jgi:hypothetical protein
MPADHVTVLECLQPGRRATKTITPDGIRGYAAGAWFAASEAQVSGISDLAALLSQIEPTPTKLIIRAALIDGRDPRRVRRLLHPNKKTGEAPYFTPRDRRWVGLDFDRVDLPEGVAPTDIDAVAAAAISLLPEPFRGVSCWAQLTSGAGIKPGGRVRLFYWLSRAAPGQEFKRLLAATKGLDTSTLNDVTPNYVAAPVFQGVTDLVPVRSRLIAGSVPQVPIPERNNKAPVGKTTSLRPHDLKTSVLAYPLYRGNCGTVGTVGTVRRPWRYAEAVLGALERVPEGQGRDACKSAAVRLYRISKAGLLDPVDVTGRIKAVMRRRGWRDGNPDGATPVELDRLLTWAWDHA